MNCMKYSVVFNKYNDRFKAHLSVFAFSLLISISLI